MSQEPEKAEPEKGEEVPFKKPNMRRANRIAAMQFLYQIEINPPEIITFEIAQFFENQERERPYYQFAEELVNAYLENRETVDETIKKYVQNWSFERIAKVDLAILRLALTELLFRKDIPPIVSINEAIDLGKDFSDIESRRLINGVLDKFKGTLNRPLRETSN